MSRARTAAGLWVVVLSLLAGCGSRGQSYDVNAVLSSLAKMLDRPEDFSARYSQYRRTPDFRSFLEELNANLQGSAAEAKEPRATLEEALALVRQHHLEKVLVQDPLLLTEYRAAIFVVLLVLERAEIEQFFVGLHSLTGAALAGEGGVRPEVLKGLARALRALRLRQPFLGASPPYAVQTHEDRLGEIPATVESALRLRQEGWRICGLYEEGRAKIARRFNHLQAVIDLVAAGPAVLEEGRPVALFLQVEQSLDGTNHDLKQAADRVEATASYIQDGGWRDDFDLPPDSKPIVALIVEEDGPELERLWKEIETRAGFLTEPVPILLAYGEGEFKLLNLTALEAQGLLRALDLRG